MVQLNTVATSVTRCMKCSQHPTVGGSTFEPAEGGTDGSWVTAEQVSSRGQGCAVHCSQCGWEGSGLNAGGSPSAEALLPPQWLPGGPVGVSALLMGPLSPWRLRGIALALLLIYALASVVNI